MMKAFRRRWLLIGIVLVIFWIGSNILLKRKEYQQDVSHIYSVAGRLAYKENDFIHFYHHETMYYDDIVLIFMTDKTVEEFETNVEQLGFALQKKYGPQEDTNFLRYLELRSDVKNLSLIKRKENNDPYTSLQLDPVATEWVLRDGKRIIQVKYLDTNARKDVWSYDGKPLWDKNIAVVSLDRHLK